jgi:hypothetical protein
VWLYEAVPFIGQSYAEVGPGYGSRIPRLLKWSNKKAPKDLEEVERVIFQIRRRVSRNLSFDKTNYVFFG